jgi:hypothetical protein
LRAIRRQLTNGAVEAAIAFSDASIGNLQKLVRSETTCITFRFHHKPCSYVARLDHERCNFTDYIQTHRGIP